ncbi:MAG TPA: ribonuclease H-like domain-containing protein [Solirubrobacterales bacterium]|nr:ribonuclease H-like domain-containing protein [Solirubrobacterales bacterium]
MDAASRKSHAARHWVDKADLLAFMRCPYAWWNLEQGLISAEEVVDLPAPGGLEESLPEGRLERLSEAPSEERLRELFSEQVNVVGLPVLENPERKIFGSPAGVYADSGALRPIDVGTHRYARRSDRLGLVFDWMVLEPYRTDWLDEPTGWLVLERDGSPTPVEVEFTKSDFEQLEELLHEIRQARQTGVKPRICSCSICASPLRDHIQRLTKGGKDLTQLFEMGRGRAAAFEEVGIANFDDLSECDAESVAEQLRATGNPISAARLEQMRFHVQSYRAGRPVLFGPPPELGDSFIALDLEYDHFTPRLWLIGLYIIDADRCEHVVLWADDAPSEQANLERLSDVLDEKADLPLVTWAGTSADLPQVKAACKRFSLNGLFDGIEERHVDLYSYARQALRLPIPEFGLAEVAAYFGVMKSSSISDGREAQMLFARYLSRYSQRIRARIRNELIAYNRDDLEALVETLWAIKELPAQKASLVPG